MKEKYHDQQVLQGLNINLKTREYDFFFFFRLFKLTEMPFPYICLQTFGSLQTRLGEPEWQTENVIFFTRNKDNLLF